MADLSIGYSIFTRIMFLSTNRPKVKSARDPKRFQNHGIKEAVMILATPSFSRLSVSGLQSSIPFPVVRDSSPGRDPPVRWHSRISSTGASCPGEQRCLQPFLLQIT